MQNDKHIYGLKGMTGYVSYVSCRRLAMNFITELNVHISMMLERFLFLDPMWMYFII